MNPNLDSLVKGLRTARDHRVYRAIDFFEPYEKQEVFFALGATKRERLLRAGNQLGKTYAGSAEMSYHLTGQYPVGWKGRRFTHPIKAWVAGVKSQAVRDGPQTLLCGQFGVNDAFGTGMIPRDTFADKPSLSRGVTDAYDTIQVKHYTNGIYDGISTLTFKSYEEGRIKFQGATLDVIWCDEEPPMDIYSECLARISAAGGMIFVTFTPLKGRSAVVNRFLSEPSQDRADIVMTIYDVKHMDAEKIRQTINSYPAHEREARTMGTPMQGEGRVFPVDEALLAEPQLPSELIPPHWSKIWGVDFGIGHPFAAVLQMWDKDSDVLHLHAAVRAKDMLPLQHCAMMRPIGAHVKVAYPKDGGDREKGTGHPLADQYREHGLLMLPTHASWPDGSISTETGIREMHERMITGRYKVSTTLLRGDWGDEFRNYHYKDGLLVKVDDDLMSASRVAVMGKRFGTPAIIGWAGRKRAGGGGHVKNVDFDVFMR